jgi:hypothetical protein
MRTFGADIGSCLLGLFSTHGFSTCGACADSRAVSLFADPNPATDVPEPVVGPVDGPATFLARVLSPAAVPSTVGCN